MKKILGYILSLAFVSTAFAAQISPSPLIAPTFSKGVNQGRVEAVYISYDNVQGGGVQGTVRFPFSDTFALTPSFGAFNLSGDHSYTDSIAGYTKMEIDYYRFISGVVRAEVQQKFDFLTCIVFGGALLHYGKSKDTTTSSNFGSTTTTSTDKGLGWEAGAHFAMKTGPFMTTLFYRYSDLRVKTTNEDSPGSSVQTDLTQTFTFQNSTLGFDLLFQNGISLSGLYEMIDKKESNSDNITMLKIGYSF